MQDHDSCAWPLRRNQFLICVLNGSVCSMDIIKYEVWVLEPIITPREILWQLCSKDMWRWERFAFEIRRNLNCILWRCSESRTLRYNMTLMLEKLTKRFGYWAGGTRCSVHGFWASPRKARGEFWVWKHEEAEDSQIIFIDKSCHFWHLLLTSNHLPKNKPASQKQKN